MQNQRVFASRLVPIGILVLGALQAALAVSDKRWVSAAAFGLVALVGGANVRQGMVVPDRTGWRTFWIALGVVVLATLALALGAAIWVRAV